MTDPILIDETVFEETYIPENLLHRKGQLEEIARCLKPAKLGKSIKNIYIFGPPGIGKTSTTKWILKENFDRNSVYVNCWSKKTSHKIMEDILLQMGQVVHGKEPTSDLVKRFERSKKKPIICLDEIDHLKDADILYVFTRNSCSLVLISNQAHALSNVDNRIKSSLFLQEIEFKPYSKDEVYDIIKERVAYGLRPHSISDSLVSVVSGMSGGDARIGLQTIKMSAKDAESKDLERISMQEIKCAVKCTRKYKLSYLLGKLNEQQKTIYEILQQGREMNSGRLLQEYNKTSNEKIPQRTYRSYMKRMNELGLVKEIGSKRGRRYEIMI